MKSKLLPIVLAAAAVAGISILLSYGLVMHDTSRGKTESASSNPQAAGSSNNAATTKPITDFNIAAAGDWGCNTNTNKTINNIVTKNPEIVLALGDLSYASTFDCWLRLIAPLESRMHVVIGNHDAGEPTGHDLPHLMRNYGLSHQFYSFNYQNVHFTVISTEQPYQVGTAQYNWIDQDLAQASQNPNIKWKIVMFHKLVYTSSSSHASIAGLRDALHPLFDKYAVDLVLQAHNHNYQRMYPLEYNRAVPSSPIITTREKTNYSGYGGEIWLVIGTGGQGHYELNGQPPYVIYQQTTEFGFLNLDFINNGNTVNGKFYSNSGSVMDSFSISKR
jgi:hypothetical protein